MRVMDGSAGCTRVTEVTSVTIPAGSRMWQPFPAPGAPLLMSTQLVRLASGVWSAAELPTAPQERRLLAVQTLSPTSPAMSLQAGPGLRGAPQQGAQGHRVAVKLASTVPRSVMEVAAAQIVHTVHAQQGITLRTCSGRLVVGDTVLAHHAYPGWAPLTALWPLCRCVAMLALRLCYVAPDGSNAGARRNHGIVVHRAAVAVAALNQHLGIESGGADCGSVAFCADGAVVMDAMEASLGMADTTETPASLPGAGDKHQPNARISALREAEKAAAGIPTWLLTLCWQHLAVAAWDWPALAVAKMVPQTCAILQGAGMLPWLAHGRAQQ